MKILELMKRRWTAADEAEDLAVRLVADALACAKSALALVAAQRHARDAADRYADALEKESNARLCELLALGPKPRRRVTKGAKRGPRPKPN